MLTNTEGLAHKHVPTSLINTSYLIYFRPTSYIIKLEGNSSFLETVQPSSVIVYIACWLPAETPDPFSAFFPTHLPAGCLTLKLQEI